MRYNYKFENQRLIKKNNETIKTMIDLYNEKLELREDHKKLKQRFSKLVSENTTLQNDLFSEQLLQDETDNYIEKLKKENKELNEFINHVKELSNYHERKKLEYKEENEKLKNKIFNYYN